MPHMARKNINMTYILMDNRIYGLTKGQVSPTSQIKMKAYTTPYGGVEEPMDPVMYMLTFGATFVAQSLATNVKLTTRLIKEAMEHKGFSFINVMSHCPTFNMIDDAKYFKDAAEDVEEGHDVTDMPAAMAAVSKARKEGRIPIGLLYKEDRPTLDERMAALVEQVGGGPDYDLKKIIDLARP